MITSNPTSEYTLVIKARELLDKGSFSAAVDLYNRIHDPEALDEGEARDMLIEAHALLSRKHLIEALEHFEDTLVMGTDVQRKQALDGILKIGEIRSKIPNLFGKLKKNLDALGVSLKDLGLASLNKHENVVLITETALEKLPNHLMKGTKISKIPQHLLDQELPISTTKCIPFADEDDIKYILDVATELKKSSSV